MKIAKAMATVAGMTGLSRIAGFVRDILTASILGAGPVADAFFVALKLPNFFRRVTAEGAFSVSFVPLYSEALETEKKDSAAIFAGQSFTIMLWALSFFVIVILLVMPLVIHGIAPGFRDDLIRYDLAVELSRVTFPYLLFMSLTALLGGILNAHDKFAPFAGAPILFNLSLIGFLLSAGHFETAGHAMAVGVLVAGFLQLGLMILFIKKYGIPIKLKIKPEMSPKLIQLFKLMGPGVIGAGVMHINLFADVIMASLLEPGAISHLYYADRLNQLPLGLVGVAVGTALLPMLSKAVAAKKIDEARDLFNRSLELCLLLALPAAVGLFILAHPIISALFEHGAFTESAASSTSMVLMAYTLGIPAYIFVKVYSSGYWAQKDTKSPVKAAIVATIVNIAMSLWFIFGLGLGTAGIALGTGLAGWLQLTLLARGLKGREETKFDDRFKRVLPRIVISCFIMGIILWFTQNGLEKFYDTDLSHREEILAMLALVSLGFLSYSLSIVMTGVLKPKSFKQYFKRN